MVGWRPDGSDFAGPLSVKYYSDHIEITQPRPAPRGLNCLAVLLWFSAVFIMALAILVLWP
jgi:hypothetical protein